MEQVEEIPFSSLVAFMLLEKPEVNCFEIVNFISKISQGEGDIIYDVIEDDCECLSICVDSFSNGGFVIKDNMTYETILYDGVTVRDYLMGIASFVRKNDVDNKEEAVNNTSNNNERQSYCSGNNNYKDYSCEYKNIRNRFEFKSKKRIRTPWMMRRA